MAVLVAACNSGGRPVAEAPDYASSGGSPAVQPTGGQGPGLYRAIPGDTVYGVAERFRVPLRTLIETNALKPPYRLLVGQLLRVPVRQEHIVQPGDTLFAVARIYGVDQSSLARINNLALPYALKPGQRLILPGRVEASDVALSETLAPEPTIPVAPSRAAVSVEQLPPPKMRPTAAAGASPATVEPAPPQEPEHQSSPAKPPAAQTAVIPEPAPRAKTSFLWPAKGKVVSRFGPKPGGLHNDGINIAAPRGTRVLAAENGVVAYAGNELRGFGNLLLIRHADGWVTAYAHNDKLLVNRGDKVRRGQVIARIGSTGNVGAPQLHFEIRKGTEPVDPLKYLGSQGAGAIPTAAPAGQPDPG